MTKEKLYLYIGDNGSILSPIHLIDVPCSYKYKLTADPDKLLTCDNVNFIKTVTVFEDNIKVWKEVDDKGQN